MAGIVSASLVARTRARMIAGRIPQKVLLKSNENYLWLVRDRINSVRWSSDRLNPNITTFHADCLHRCSVQSSAA